MKPAQYGFAAIMLVCLNVQSAFAGPVVVDYEPYHSGGAASDTAFTSPFNSATWQTTADRFSLGSPCAIQSIQWWGYFFLDNPTSPQSEVIEVSVLESRADGMPGNVLFDQQFASPMRAATGVVILGLYRAHEYQYTVDLASPLSLASGTQYWLEVAAIGDPDSAFLWEYSLADHTGFVYLNSLVPDWKLDAGIGTAFKLIATPEPATCALAAVAIGFFVRRGRRCRGK